MASRRVSAWYDGEEDMFETLWAFREAYFTPSDDAGNPQAAGRQCRGHWIVIHDMSTLK